MKYLIIISIFLASCNPCKYVSKHPECFPADTVKIINTVIQKDSIYFTEPDTMAISLLFECDSNNNVLMRELKDVSSKGIQTKVIFKDNRLDISGYVDSISILNKLIETTRSKEIVKLNPINQMLEDQNIKLSNKVKNRNKLIISFVVVLLLMGLYIKFK